MLELTGFDVACFECSISLLLLRLARVKLGRDVAGTRAFEILGHCRRWLVGKGESVLPGSADSDLEELASADDEHALSLICCPSSKRTAMRDAPREFL